MSVIPGGRVGVGAMASSVDWVLLAGREPAAGDVVSAEPGGMPLYRVVSVADGEALLQDERHHTTQKMPLARFQWKLAQA